MNSGFKMKIKMKIVMSANTSWFLYNFRLGLIRGLRKEGYDVVIIAPKDEFSKLFIEEGFKFLNISMAQKGINPFTDIKTIISYYKILKELKPDLVVNYTIKPNIYCSIAAKKLNISVINNIEGLGYLFVNKNIITKLAIYMYKFSQKFAKKILFLNNDDMFVFTNEYKIIKKNKAELLPSSGIDSDKFSPVYKDIKPRDKFTFILVSRLLYDKGITEYVEAASRLINSTDKVEFQLLGFLESLNPKAIPKSKIDEWVKNGMINYLGETNDVRSFLSKVDCKVLPSYREGIPKSLLEAGAMEIPIITTDTVGCKEVVENGYNGFLCKVKDTNDLVDKMKKMIRLSNEERELMGKRSREKIIREFDENIVIDKYLMIIKSVLYS